MHLTKWRRGNVFLNYNNIVNDIRDIQADAMKERETNPMILSLVFSLHQETQKL